MAEEMAHVLAVVEAELPAVESFNDTLAVGTTNVISTMWCAYAFVLLSALPLIWSAQKDNILYLSNCFQLIFLPLIMVGQNLLGKTAEDRAKQDHESIMRIVCEIRDMHTEMHDALGLAAHTDSPVAE